MNRAIGKLVVALMALVLSVVMVVTISYAWMSLSSTPVVEGIQITIGGGNTILVAANLTETVDGVEYNYPGFFRDTINFNSFDEYDYLQDMAGLTPVSTADGIYWFVPERYDILDEEVINGSKVAGQLKPVNDFYKDATLTHANLAPENELAQEGHYIYLDFWVVSPGTDYTLRVSTGEDAGGSYVLDLMNPVKTEDGTFQLAMSDGIAQASARVGFLVNENYVIDNTMYYYQGSSSFNPAYTKLRGSYQQPGGSMWYSDSYRFTIYEPNGNYHPTLNNGDYYITSPIALNGDIAYEADISDRLIVQLANSWVTETVGNKISIRQMFTTALLNKDVETADEAKTLFYDEYLQGQLMNYVSKGEFVKSTQSLYKAAGTTSSVSKENFDKLGKAGATDDVYIVTLEKDVPQRIRMFVWIEGQDIDCNDNLSVTDLTLSIELAGSSKKGD